MKDVNTKTLRQIAANLYKIEGGEYFHARISAAADCIDELRRKVGRLESKLCKTDAGEKQL